MKKAFCCEITKHIFEGSVRRKILNKQVGVALLVVLTLVGQAVGYQVVGSVDVGSQPFGNVVNPATDRVYMSGGFAQNQMTVIDASDPTNPTIVTTISGSAGGSGVTANPFTNRFYTSNGFGGQVIYYDGSTNLEIPPRVSIGTCPGDFDIDVTTDLVYVVRQCGSFNDPLYVLNGSTNSLVAGPLGSSGIVGQVRVNSTTGRAYVGHNGGTRVFGPSPGFSFVTDLPGFIQAVNPATNRLYFSSGSDLQVRDGNDHSLIATISGAGGPVGVNTSRNRIYVPDPTNEVVKVIDGETNTVIGTFSLGAGVVPSPSKLAVDSTKGRIYVAATVGSSRRLFVVQLCQFALVGDLNGDCRVGLSDLAMMAANWLVDCGLTPGDPACIPE